MEDCSSGTPAESIFKIIHKSFLDRLDKMAAKSAHDAAKYWREHLAGLAPCQFPRLDGKSQQRTKRPMTVRINLQDSQKLQELVGSEESALQTTLRAVWALLLKCYTDSEDVCFGYQETGSGALDMVANGLGGMSVARLKIEDGTTLGEFVDFVKSEYTQSLPYLNHGPLGSARAMGTGEHQLFNTALVLRTAANSGVASPRSGPLNMTLPEEVSGVMKLHVCGQRC